MAPRNAQEDSINKYIQQRIREARNEASETQDDLAESLRKNRVSISDIERGRIAINAADLAQIAFHYGKPISYFFPERLTISKETLSNLDEELLALFWELYDDQKYLAIENIRQQVEISRKARNRMFDDSRNADEN